MQVLVVLISLLVYGVCQLLAIPSQHTNQALAANGSESGNGRLMCSYRGSALDMDPEPLVLSGCTDRDALRVAKNGVTFAAQRTANRVEFQVTTDNSADAPSIDPWFGMVQMRYPIGGTGTRHRGHLTRGDAEIVACSTDTLLKYPATH